MKKMRVPVLYTPATIKNWHIDEEYEPGKYRLSRPCAFTGWKHFLYRLRISFGVFTGKYDALNWLGTGEKSNKDIHYRDILDPDFGKNQDQM